MRLTTKGRYAVTAILDLAMHADHGPVSLAEIAATMSAGAETVKSRLRYAMERLRAAIARECLEH